MGKKKLLSLMKWSIPMFLSTICLMNENPSPVVEAAKGASHIGTFNGSTTFRTSSSNGINPGLFIEVMDEYGRLTQYESEDGVITIPDTKEGAYITQAKLLGKTKYKDIDSGEILDTWEEGRNLELVSVENPELKTIGKNLFDGWMSGEIDGATGLLTPVSSVVSSDFIKIPGYGKYTSSNNSISRNVNVFLYDQKKNFIARAATAKSTFSVGTGAYMRLSMANNNNDKYQLEKTSTMTPYEPYKENVVSFDDDITLRGIGEVRDELDLMTGEVMERVGEVYYDGENENSDDSYMKQNPYGDFYFQVHFKNLNKGNAHGMSDKLNTAAIYDTVRLERNGFCTNLADSNIIRFYIDGFLTIEEYKNFFSMNPITIQYILKAESMKQIDLNNTYTFPPVRGRNMAVNGTVSTTIGSITVPTDALAFTLNPNLEAGQQFVAPEFTISNDSHAPITLGVKSFVQTTDVLNDVSPDKYSSWEGLNKTESRDIALALIPKPSDNWVSLTEKPYYVTNTTNETIGQIKGNSSVDFSFEALHGQAFSEVLNPQYQLTFVFEF